MEVDCNLLTTFPSIDAHIDLIKATDRYLHSSPEYAMKRLLAQGSGDIYQMGHVFRAEEQGNLHQPEFTMAEWYRVGFTFQQMMDETVAYAKLFLGEQPVKQVTYQELFQETLDIDPLTATYEELRVDVDFLQTKDDCLNYLITERIEPTLKGFTLVSHYPASQAALAQTCGDVAERFELFYNSYELANGYHELSHAEEQRKRFHEANEIRTANGKEEYQIDEQFLSALNALPDCCGVAVGFDRLMMLRHNETCLEKVLPFNWNNI